ncbi:LA_0442/LA_0875 N-terminal domain-containing protein [Leptospira mayottensis]|uniref:DUF5683 domain-containing protein n=2 Tax=Leptospira mayottensis TaxID=1137606 RepID=A0AA87SVR2_9LEPT|nr:DUF5683 domain-containing protein [Leptospira mayottensis]AXR62781.1 hypothetical protein DQM68_19190 [Leptospira mayottensis]AXR66324.1 hypothetical protein DQM28_19045 [Leptospira mayottensis]AXR70107.1 hypothetical protein DPV73_19170 [Leptospira mayottensis]AZQ03927.1 hypothetical protein LEP1GSC190_17785 [Leptospira mayottensis 200901116]EKR99147.1 hypothetical protein LEP1GSC125_3697 [Leptospira mayottensis 200901122]
MKLSLKKLFLTFVVFLIVVFSISAETVLLQEGGSYRGKVITQNQKTITIQTKEGKRVIPKREVLKVIYKDINEAEEEKVRNIEIQKLEEEKLSKQKDHELKKQQMEEERLRKEREEMEKNNPFPLPPSLPKEPEISRAGALARSAVLPGWGQWASGRKFAAILYPTLFLAAGYAVYENNRKYVVAKKEYENYGNPYTKSSLTIAALGIPNPDLPPVISDPVALHIYNQNFSPYQDKREAVDKAYKNLQTSIGVLAGVYLINLADAFLFGGQISSKVGISNGATKGLIFDYNPMANSGISNGGFTSAATLESKYTFGYRYQF